MNNTPAPLLAHMALGSTTLAYIARLRRRDGFVLPVGLDHNRAIEFEFESESLVYTPIYGLIPSTIQSSAYLNVENMDAKGALMLLGIDEADIAAGLWDLCAVLVMRVNWKDPSMGCEIKRRGWFGEISLGRNTFNAEIMSLTQKLQATIGDELSASCDADLFDARCGVVKTEGVNMFSGVAVSTLVVAHRQFTCAALTQAAGFFDGGKVEWTGGPNAGMAKEIKAHTAGGNIELQEPMPYPIAATHQATFLAGCLKRYAEDCGAKHGNQLRFRGYPFAPGQDQVFKGV